MRREKIPAEIPTEDEINQQLIADTIRPGPRYQNEPLPSAPPVEPPAEPSVGAKAEIPTEGEGDNPAVAEAMQQQAQADDSRNVLLEQLHALQAAQEAQRQQYSRLKPPQTREQWVAALMQQSGTTQAEAEFLLNHPAMMYEPKAMQRTMADIQAAGVQRDDSPEYFQAVEETFNRHLERKQKKAAAKASAEPPPEFFQPPAPAPQEPVEQPQSVIFSAPVSRQAGGGGGIYQPSPNSVRLSAEEQQIARASGLSDLEYAKQKLKMLRMQQTGQIQR